jgi:general nucleoside transport system permease protein
MSELTREVMTPPETRPPPPRALAGWRIERRSRPRWVPAYRVGAIVAGIVVALLIGPLLSTTSSSQFYRLAWNGTLGTSIGIGSVLTVATPLVIAGLAAAIPYRVGLWNIGIDGQILIGAWAATGVGFLLGHLAGIALVPLMFLAGMVGGGAWALAPALGRAFLGINEIVTTFLLNFVALAWMTYWVTGRWADPGAVGGGVRSRALPAQSQLGLIDVNGAVVHWGVLIAVVLPVGAWLILRSTRMGYELTIAGASDRAGRYAGIAVRRKLIGALVAGGAIGGLGGVVDLLGSLHQYGDGLTNNTGFTALVIAVLAGGSELGILLTGFIYALLLVGGDAVSVAGVQPEVVFSLVGATLLFAAGGEAFARLRFVPVARAGRGGARLEGGEQA